MAQHHDSTQEFPRPRNVEVAQGIAGAKTRACWHAAPVRHTIARGRVLAEEEVAARARERAPELWRRFHALGWGTPYLGEEP